jgi:adenosylcobinamide-phosphate synthase
MAGLLIALITACLLDIMFGDPPNRFHPVAAMGKMIHTLSNVYKGSNPVRQFLRGVILIIMGGILFALPVFIVTRWMTQLPFWPRWILTGILLKPVFAFRRLIEAGVEIQDMLQLGKLTEARRLTSWHLVSRDTSRLLEGNVSSAVIESLAENLTDSFLSPLLFFILFGLPGAWFYRYVNTADAMIGYHTERYEYLGKFAARLDDVMNWLPARLAALCLVMAAGLSGLDAGEAWNVMRDQHARTSSPNAGWTMAAAAGALGVRLEKHGCYQLNETRQLPEAYDIHRANKLVSQAAVIGMVVLAGMVIGIEHLV